MAGGAGPLRICAALCRERHRPHDPPRPLRSGPQGTRHFLARPPPQAVAGDRRAWRAARGERGARLGQACGSGSGRARLSGRRAAPSHGDVLRSGRLDRDRRSPRRRGMARHRRRLSPRRRRGGRPLRRPRRQESRRRGAGLFRLSASTGERCRTRGTRRTCDRRGDRRAKPGPGGARRACTRGTRRRPCRTGGDRRGCRAVRRGAEHRGPRSGGGRAGHAPDHRRRAPAGVGAVRRGRPGNAGPQGRDRAGCPLSGDAGERCRAAARGRTYRHAAGRTRGGAAADREPLDADARGPGAARAAGGRGGLGQVPAHRGVPESPRRHAAHLDGVRLLAAFAEHVLPSLRRIRPAATGRAGADAGRLAWRRWPPGIARWGSTPLNRYRWWRHSWSCRCRRIMRRRLRRPRSGGGG